MASNVPPKEQSKPALPPPIEYPTGLKLASILTSVYLAMFLVSLDRTIIGTAVPKITDDFHSLNDIGWYASGYLLPGASFMLLFGKLYRLYPVKSVYLSCITVFEIGSAVCGSAPSSKALIVGRAIQGLGSAGLFSGSVMILIHTVPLQKRPLFQGIFGAIIGVSSVVGPLLGGAFTDHVSWRWCFYINLPFGALVIAIITIFLHVPGQGTYKTLSIRQQITQLDPPGTAVFLPGMVLLLLALQWGGSEYPWSSARVVSCLVLASVLLLAFIAIQIWRKEKATIPIRILKQRSVVGAVCYMFFTGASMQTVVYYIPIWFQSIQGISAVQAGIRTIALVLPLVLATIFGGILASRTGYYVPQMISSSVLLSIGAGMLTTWTVYTSRGKWIGYQVIYGFGLGLGIQAPNLAMQATLSRLDVPMGTALMFFSQMLGGSVFVSAAQNVFASELRRLLGGVQGVNVEALIRAGAVGMRHVVDPITLREVLEVFNKALVSVFYVAVAVSCTSSLGSLMMEWRSIKNGEGQGERSKIKAVLAERLRSNEQTE
ncbi:putative MFS multidrug transporter [Lophiotrema nucula]|uniref:Putative MFS multidrug transporter n=1 Tax=Lophiotrema nucula TaxID=690887 RepID=A0A6A5ZUQ4_9PLEO|nr:putative MFS multidrug transporter [Lophiotrema nucula]